MRIRTVAGTGSRQAELHRDRPDALWVTDLTYVPTRSRDGVCVFHRRRVLPPHCWVAGRVEHAHRHGPRRARDGRTVPRRETFRRTRHTFRCRSQFTSVRFTERLDEIGARPSIGTVADSYDNALAETTNGLYKTECVYGPDTNGWDDVDELELATLSWAHWFNEQRLHSHCDAAPPAEFEAAFYAALHPDQTDAWNPINRASIRPRAVHSAAGSSLRIRSTDCRDGSLNSASMPNLETSRPSRA